MERVVKVVCIAQGCRAGYPYSEWRVVECYPGQRGYLNEREVKVLWRSQDLYRPYATRRNSKGYQARQQAERIATQARLTITTQSAVAIA